MDAFLVHPLLLENKQNKNDQNKITEICSLVLQTVLYSSLFKNPYLYMRKQSKKVCDGAPYKHPITATPAD